MDFDLPSDDDPRRLAVRASLEANPKPSGNEVAETGYVVRHWPPPWGIEAELVLRLPREPKLERGVTCPETREA